MTRNILDAVYEFSGRFVVFPNEASRVAHTLWTAHTHLTDAYRNTPRLVVNSATRGCGKSTLLDVTALLVPRAMPLISPTPASLYALIEKQKPTLLIDQSDTMFATGKDMSEIVGIIDAGFTKGRKRPKVNTETGQVQMYDVFGPMLLAGIDRGNLDGSVIDRSIVVSLQKNIGARKMPVEVFRERHETQGHALRGEIEAWANAAVGKIKSVEPAMPDLIRSGRFADKWEPLFVVADMADRTSGTGIIDIPDGTDGTLGMWGTRARQAALDYLRQEQDDEAPDYGELVLKHICQIFDETKLPFVSTSVLLQKLHDMPEAPWSSYHSNWKPISDRGLGKLLRPFKIRSKQSTGRDKTRGYYRRDFDDVFSRHVLLETPENAAPLVSPVPPVQGAIVLDESGKRVREDPLWKTYGKYMDTRPSQPSW